MWGKKPKDETKIKEPKLLLIPVFILVAAIIILGLYPQIVLNLIEPATNQLPYSNRCPRQSSRLLCDFFLYPPLFIAAAGLLGSLRTKTATSSRLCIPFLIRSKCRSNVLSILLSLFFSNSLPSLSAFFCIKRSKYGGWQHVLNNDSSKVVLAVYDGLRNILRAAAALLFFVDLGLFSFSKLDDKRKISKSLRDGYRIRVDFGVLLSASAGIRHNDFQFLSVYSYSSSGLPDV